MKKITILMMSVLIIVNVFTIRVQAQETSLEARNVYIYDWTSVSTEVNNSEVKVKSDWQSVFTIDETIKIFPEYSALRWFSLGGRRFFVQFTPGGAQEAVFIGEINGIPQVMKIQFYGDLVQINSRGVVYQREGVIYCKPLYPKGMTGNWHYPEKQGWSVEDPYERYSNGDLIAVPAEPLF